MTAAWKCIVVALALRQEVREAWNLAQQTLTVVPKLLHATIVRAKTTMGAAAGGSGGCGACGSPSAWRGKVGRLPRVRGKQQLLDRAKLRLLHLLPQLWLV